MSIGFAVLILLILYAPPTIQFVLPVISFCILVIAPIMLLLDRIGLEEEEEDVEFCAYAIMGAAFNTIMVSSPTAIATLTNPEFEKNFEGDDSFLCLSISTISINPYL
jgi:hypothetical protein